MLSWFTKGAQKKNEIVQHFSRNKKGRDFVVGDVHGMFTALKDLLIEVEFDEKVDRVFSLGDLIDRGSESEQSCEWWSKPWFHAILGNHEDMLQRRTEMAGIWHANGGQWWMRIQKEERQKYDDPVMSLPLAIEVDTASGLVGLVHADLLGNDWDAFCDKLKQKDKQARQVALWSRKRIDGLKRGDPAVKIANIDHIYIGHSVVEECISYENISFIDTGACYLQSENAKLTLMQIHPYIQNFKRYTSPKFG